MIHLERLNDLNSKQFNFIIIKIKGKNVLHRSKTLHITALLLGITACQQHFKVGPTLPTEAALVANAYQNGLSTELNISYEEAYTNLRIAYGRCVAFTGETDFVYTDNRFEPNFEMATLFGRTKGGVYLYKTTVESMSPHTTRLTLYVPNNYTFAQARFKQDIKRALGLDEQCNLKK